MSYKIIISGVLLAAMFGLSGLQAQTMYVKKHNGSRSGYALTSLQKIEFSSGNIILFEESGNNDVYASDELEYLSFFDFTSGTVDLEDFSNLRFTSYPNPVTDVLQVDLFGTGSYYGTFSILNLEGRVIKTRVVNGENRITLSLKQIPPGLYLCRFSNGKEIKTEKIIKQ